ncbi:MAG TPA: BamA/TamA family outer membrane protein [Allosphingosinicella sp.]|nr:BamA/TamA family outer membrane protein [Allosphingosinicella sp.]
MDLGSGGHLNKAGILMGAVAAGALALATAASAQTDPPQTPPADEPIVTDSQFDKELPALDPELGKPLEPLEDFAGPPPATTPEGELIPDATVTDPELERPLTPISEFDVTTPPPTQSDEDDEEKVEPVRYTLVVEGLDEIGLEGRFRDLSALEDADGEATNGAQISARAKEDELLAVRLLRSEGYYDATALSSIEQLPDQPGGMRVVVSAVPGQRYLLGNIAIDGPQTEPPDLAREALPLKTEDPIVAINVEAAEANVRLRLPQQGYPFAEVGLRDILLDPETRHGDYTLPVSPGNRSRFAGFTTEGDLAFGAKHVEVLSRFKRGDLYDSRKVDDLREAMIATNLFTTVSAEPVATGEKAEDGTEYVNILVKQDAGPARSLAGTAGYSTGEGFRAEATWEHRNLFPPEGSLRLNAILGTQEQSVGVTLRRNNWKKRDRSIFVQVEAGRRDLPAFKGYTVRLRGQAARESTPIWQKVWTYAVGAELIATNEAQVGFPRLSLDDTFFLAGVSGQVGYDRSNSLLDPTKGFRLKAFVNPETSLREPGQPYIRNIVDGSVYYPAGDSLVVAGRARVGSIYGAELAELAPSRRLYAGGGGSVRGFGFQELGPRIKVANPDFDPTDPDEKDDPTIFVPTGGRSLVEFAVEARYRFGNYGIVGFVDAGQVYESQTPRLNDMRFGVGVGGRIYTNFGPLCADVAMPIGRRKGESRFAVYVSIGQAF